jgi:hypothetical protein
VEEFVMVMFLANSYLDKNNPTCREERQFALLLNNKLKNEDSKIMENLDLKGHIVDVFYEPTLMRDYWYDKKVIFNSLLIEYIENKFKHVSDIGPNKGYHINFWRKKHPYGVSMMSAKPDIGVISCINNEYYLDFIECKYKSCISVYQYDGFPSLTQVEVQEYILEFLCDYLNLKIKDSLGNDSVIKKGKVIKVKFDVTRKSRRTVDSNGFKLINIKQIMY